LEKQSFPSEISKPLMIAVLGLLGTIAIFFFIQQSWVGFGILIVTIWFVSNTIFNTYYVIEDSVLTIKSGLLYHRSIDVFSIKMISQSTSIQSSPSVSFNRICLTFGKFEEVIVSPADQKGFINVLIKINSDIQIDKDLK